MTIGSWATKDPIPIKGHSFEDFKEFLTFLYLGRCDFDLSNVMTFVDLAESYGIVTLKNECNKFLCGTPPTPGTVFGIYESLKLFSLEEASKKITEFITTNTEMLLKSKHFLEVKKGTILDIVRMQTFATTEEELFKAVCFWNPHHGEYDPICDHPSLITCFKLTL